MAIPTTFTWFPDTGAQLTEKPSVRAAKFGDGYEQRTPDGINTKPQKWSLTFTSTRTRGLLILTFLRARAGHEAFNWTNPLNEAGVYICREWRMDPSSKPGSMKITCDFEQVFQS